MNTTRQASRPTGHVPFRINGRVSTREQERISQRYADTQKKVRDFKATNMPVDAGRELNQFEAKERFAHLLQDDQSKKIKNAVGFHAAKGLGDARKLLGGRNYDLAKAKTFFEAWAALPDGDKKGLPFRDELDAWAKNFMEATDGITVVHTETDDDHPELPERGDIAAQNGSAIMNPAPRRLLGGKRGAARAIESRFGKRLSKALSKLKAGSANVFGNVPVGDQYAVAIDGGAGEKPTLVVSGAGPNLNHYTGLGPKLPRLKGKGQPSRREEAQLHQAYRNYFQAVLDYNKQAPENQRIKELSLLGISSGIFGYPKAEVAKIAMQEWCRFRTMNPGFRAKFFVKDDREMSNALKDNFGVEVVALKGMPEAYKKYGPAEKRFCESRVGFEKIQKTQEGVNPLAVDRGRNAEDRRAAILLRLVTVANFIVRFENFDRDGGLDTYRKMLLEWDTSKNGALSKELHDGTKGLLRNFATQLKTGKQFVEAPPLLDKHPASFMRSARQLDDFYREHRLGFVGLGDLRALECENPFTCKADVDEFINHMKESVNLMRQFVRSNNWTAKEIGESFLENRRSIKNGADPRAANPEEFDASKAATLAVFGLSV